MPHLASKQLCSWADHGKGGNGIMGMLGGRHVLLNGQHQEWMEDISAVVHPRE